jgi:energy-coupling factor transporter ATP-binding protein EcfA2
VPELANIESFCRIVEEAGERRRIFIEFQSLQGRVLAEDPLEEVAADARKIVSEIEGKQQAAAVDDLKSVYSFDSDGIEFVIDGLFAASAITAITGDSAAGKSTLISALAGHVACNTDFLGRKCSPRKVLILDKENTLPVVQERLKRLGVQDGGDLKYWGSWQPTDVPSPASPSILRWVIQTHPKPLVIVDSFIAFLNGDENDASVVRGFMHELRRLADVGAAVIILHHSGKGESSRDYRGSSDFKAAIDVGFSLAKLSDGDLDKLRLKAFKTRFLVETDLIINYRDGAFSVDDRPSAVERELTKQLAGLLRENPEVTAAEFETLAVQARLGRNKARRFLQDGLRLGDVLVRVGERNNEKRYRLKEPQEPEL